MLFWVHMVGEMWYRPAPNVATFARIDIMLDHLQREEPAKCVESDGNVEALGQSLRALPKAKGTPPGLAEPGSLQQGTGGGTELGVSSGGLPTPREMGMGPAQQLAPRNGSMVTFIKNVTFFLLPLDL